MGFWTLAGAGEVSGLSFGIYSEATKWGIKRFIFEWPLYPQKEQLMQSLVNTHDKVFNVDSQGTPGMVSSVGAHTERGVWASSASLPSKACMVHIFPDLAGPYVSISLQPTTYIDLKYACFFPRHLRHFLGCCLCWRHRLLLHSATASNLRCKMVQVDGESADGDQIVYLFCWCVQPMIASI